MFVYEWQKWQKLFFSFFKRLYIMVVGHSMWNVSRSIIIKQVHVTCTDIYAKDTCERLWWSKQKDDK